MGRALLPFSESQQMLGTEYVQDIFLYYLLLK